MKYKKISVTTIISFLLTLTICFLSIVFIIRNKNSVEKLDMEQLILEKSIEINETISKLLYKTQALSALVVQSNGEIENFERVAATIVDNPAILNVIIAPYGIVSNVYPLQGNENVLGFDLLWAGSPGNKEAIMAKESGQLVFGGPFSLIQGGQALVGRLPVFVDTPEGNKEFWGLVSVTLKYPEVLDGAGLDILEKQGFSYEIWRINPDDNERQIIAGSGYHGKENAIFAEKHIPILNADWYFRIISVDAWYQYSDVWIFAFIGLVISFLVAFFMQSNFKLKLIKSELEIKITESAILTDELNKEKNRADMANSAKSSFLANMSHEIRTPMNGVIGFAELAIDDDEVSAKTKDYIEKIKSSAEGLLGIIDDILDISKIESGKMELEMIPFHIDETLTICSAISNLKAMEKGINLFFDTEPISQKLLGDPTKLRQILLNLLSNAIKFTSKGEVTLVTAVEKLNENNISIRFEVRDSGIGIASDQIERIFKPFAQADNSTTRKYGGTGLGLTIAKDMIELMGGQLKVCSTQYIGSVFSFTLTFEIVDEITEVSNINEIRVSETKRPIFEGDALVCEDNITSQEVIQEHLIRLGFNITTAPNGKIGVEMAQDRMISGNPFDIIFMDMHMPVMDGIEATKELMSIGNKTPVIALTAGVTSNDLELYKDSSILSYLSKPFKAQELWKCLLEYLTPVEPNAAINTEIGLEQYEGNKKLYGRIIENFAKNNKNTLIELQDAIVAGDIKLMHRIVHSIGSAAGMIGAVRLSNTALTIENSLLERERVNFTEENIFDEQMRLLKNEFNAVFDELEAFAVKKEKDSEYKTGVVDREKMLELIQKLEPLLKTGNSKSLEFLDEIKEVFWPVADKYRLFIKQMDIYDFELAWDTMQDIKRFMRV